MLSHAACVLADERSSPEQIEIYRRMSGEERLRVAERLYWSAWKMKLAGLRAQHPDLSEDELKREARRIFLYART